MKFIPLFIDFNGRKVLFVGGGRVAERKLGLFDGAGAEITVIAPEISTKIEEFRLKNEIRVFQREAALNDVSREYFIVYAASDDKTLNSKIAQKCKELNILCNRCDKAEDSSFINGAVVCQGDIAAAVISNGVPTVSQFIKRKMEAVITPELEKAASLAKKIRNECKSKTCNLSEITLKLLSEENLEKIKQGKEKEIEQEVIKCL